MKKVTWGLFIIFITMLAGAAEIPPTASQLGLMKGFLPSSESRIYLPNMLQPPNTAREGVSCHSAATTGWL